MLQHTKFNSLSLLSSVIQYRIISWGNSSHSKGIFILPYKIIEIIAGTKAGISCASPCKMLDILSLPCDYTFSLMNFTATNIFKEITTVQHSHKRYRPSVNLPCFQKSLYCAGTKNINILPPSIKCMDQKRQH